jgi:poly(hydroxyalkanoate) depolymerase family esterase
MKYAYSLLITLFIVSSALGQALQRVSNFGSNPGNLEMYLYAPPGTPANAPVVVAMHGCTQTAQSYADESGWSTLANRFKFYVVYPQQISGNNSSRCFNWFENGDISRGQGEARSIKSMVDYMKANFSVNAAQVSATGFSAGGGMTTVMLATYPDEFTAGAVMAGLPYRAATSLTEAFTAMSPGINRTPSQWGNLVRGAFSSYTGPYPRLSVFHGTSDFIVSNANLTEIAEQWTNVLGTDATADLVQNNYQSNNRITRRAYTKNGTEVVVTYDIASMGHTVAIDPGTGTRQGGTIGGYSTDVDFFSSYYAAEFFGITGTSTPPPPPPPPSSGLAAPSNLTASATSSTTVSLSWTDNTTTEEGFRLERATSGSNNFTQIASLAANTTSFTNSGLSAETSYTYRIRAFSGSTNSAYSNQASVTTPTAGGGSGPEFTIQQLSRQGYISTLNLYNSAQSFTLNQAAVLNKVEVDLRNAITGSTLRIYTGNSTSGTPMYTQAGVSAGSGWQSISLSNTLNLAPGQYTFQLTNSAFGYALGNPYNGGVLWLNALQYTFYDATFRLTLQSTSGARLAIGQAPEVTPQASDLAVYPNPSAGQFSLQLPPETQQVLLYNTAGKVVYQLNNPATYEAVRLPSYSPGIYLLRAEGATFNRTLKVVLR